MKGINKTTSELSKLLEGELLGEKEVIIKGISGIEEAREDEITFLLHKRYQRYLKSTKAACIIVPFETKIEGLSKTFIRVKNPILAYNKLIKLFFPSSPPSRRIHPKATLGKGCEIGEGVTLGAFAVIEDGAKIGRESIIGAGVYIGPRVKIGEECHIFPNVSIREGSVIGNKVIIHSNTTVGSDGFGYGEREGKLYKIEQIGGVIIEDEVEIGSGVSIDRGTLEATQIGEGSKIDNLVQIAHNVKIGKNCRIVAQVGIAGSVKIGNNVVIGGQTGITEHVKIGDNCMIGAKSGIMRDVPPNSVVSGVPVMAHRETLKRWSLIERLPEILKKLKNGNQKN
jgi:UDP-3-O-[3-hydroxymyristoyl] glucosamine N-acyltransferase